MPAIAMKKAQPKRPFIPPEETAPVKKRNRSTVERRDRLGADRVRENFSKLDGEVALTEKEVEAVGGPSANTLRVWRAQGKGPAFLKLGFSIRYKVKVIREMLADGKNYTP